MEVEPVRHVTPPPSNISTSSTFRKLPSAVLGSFRREKATSPHDDGRNVLSASRTSNTDQLLPPSRTSSLPMTPADPEPIIAGPFRAELEPVMYPLHLAQTQAPDGTRVRETTLGPVMVSSVGVNHIVPTLAQTSARSADLKLEGIEVARRRRATTIGKSASNRQDEFRSRKASSRIATSTNLEPRLPCAKSISTKVPSSAMYYSMLACHGKPPSQPLRAHTGTVVGERIWFMGGMDNKNCWRRMAFVDTETLSWSTIETFGDQLPPLRAHTCVLVGQSLVIFGGGDGPTYSNDVWVFDTVSHRFDRPIITNSASQLPPPRRAHTAVLYKQFMVVFGGGNGQAALNDVWALDVSDIHRLTWHEWKTTGDIPHKKGYHTANLVGSKMIVFGGSDGHASFADVHILDLETLVWTLVHTEVRHNRLSHTTTQVGSYLFVVGGHNGQSYAQDLLLFNLVELQWETKYPRGCQPPGRGYHVAVLHDCRIYVFGGYNGVNVFDDLWALDLSAAAYLPQVTNFAVDEIVANSRVSPD